MIEWLLDTTPFPPRAECCTDGTWPPWFSVMYASGGLLIGIAYFLNPIMLLYIVRKYRLDQRHHVASSLLAIWAAFTFICGAGHIFSDVMPFWYPAYHFICVWNWLTAAVSYLANFTLAWVLISLARTKII